MNKKTKIIILSIIGVLIVVLSGFSYAYYMKKEISGNVDNAIVLSTFDYGNVIVTYENGKNNFNAAMIDLPQEEAGTNKNYIIKFQINNDSSLNNEIAIKWINLTNTFCQYANNQECTNNSTHTYVGDELSYQLYSCTLTQYNNVTNPDDTDITSCTKISNATDQAVPVTGSTNRLQNTSSITLSPNTTTYYIVRVILKNLTTPQRYNMDKSFDGSINVEFYVPTLVDKILAAHPPVSDAITSTYVTSASGIDFAAISSPTNGQGLYINNKANITGDPTQGTIKYFRGGTYCYLSGAPISSSSICTTAGGTWSNYHCSLSDSQNACTTAGGTFYELKNNVMFGGYAWKIVRINADGSIRLIYNGTSPTARGANAQTGKSAFKSSPYNDNTYVGYRYGAAGKSTYAATHTNATNSTIKGVVDTWYSNNLSSSASKIADAGFCGDRSMRSGDLGYGTNATYYGAYVRLYTNETPTFNCPNTDLDLYTLTTNSIGNKKLTYPIGLITADEVAYAGSVYGANNYTYYMQSGSYYWTMSPYFFYGSYAYEFSVSPFGYLYSNYVYYTTPAARPAVSLKSETTISGGTGTLTDPWIIAS